MFMCVSTCVNCCFVWLLLDDYRKYACGLVSDYLSASVAQDLKQHFGQVNSLQVISSVTLVV